MVQDDGMCEMLIKINCPHCQRSKVVKNGKKKNGSKNLLCRDCRKQFLSSYHNQETNLALQAMILRMLARNSSIRDIEQVLQVSRHCVPGTLCRHGTDSVVAPRHKYYASVQIDEVWRYVGKKKNGKFWLFYAYSAGHNEVHSYVCGSRSASTVRGFMSSCRALRQQRFAPTTGLP